ncbi:MAG: ankyrin repeat domain-containing protein [Planctomycetaceae bacterium]|nr:ankyrin repeat domain-containing protein [Planctomycetaceae bacterium]
MPFQSGPARRRAAFRYTAITGVVFICICLVVVVGVVFSGLRNDSESLTRSSRPPQIQRFSHQAGGATRAETFDSTSAAASELDLFSMDTQELIRQHDNRVLAAFCYPAMLTSGFQAAMMRAQAAEPIDEHGNTLLHLAARSGNYNATVILSLLQADPRVRNRFDESPADILQCGDSRTRNRIAAVLSTAETVSGLRERQGNGRDEMTAGADEPEDPKTAPEDAEARNVSLIINFGAITAP